MANCKRIEQLGIHEVERFLLQSEYLEPQFKENDKTPSWDGFIYVYSNKNQNKENIQRIPVQIKSSTSTKIKNNQIKKSFSKADLENYYNEGGILIFFIGNVSNTPEIFYRFFQKIDLSRVLISMKENQKEKSLEFDRICHNIEGFEIECQNFLLNKPKQHSLSDFNTPFNESDKVIEGIYRTEEDFFQSLLNSNQYLSWKSSEDTKIFDNVALITVEKISRCIGDQKVRIGNLDFIYKVKITRCKDKTKIDFGENIHFIIPCSDHGNSINTLTHKEQSNSVPGNKLDYLLRNSLDKRIQDVKFLIAFFQNSIVHFGEIPVLKYCYSNNEEKKNSTISELSQLLVKLNQICELLDVFHIDHKRIALDDLTEKDSKALNFLVEHIVMKKPLIKEKMSSTLKYHVNFSGIGLLITFIGQNDTYQVVDFCDIGNIKVEVPDADKDYLCSQYVFLDHQDIVQNDNISLNKMLESIKSCEQNPFYNTRVTQTILELIKAFDKTKKCTYLDSALNLLEWINNNDEIVDRINTLQIYKRKRRLMDNEKKELKKIEVKSTDIQILCCINILLEENSQFEKNFASLNAKEQHIFQEYPIYSLYKATSLPKSTSKTKANKSRQLQ
jgi:hypothetical protein